MSSNKNLVHWQNKKWWKDQVSVRNRSHYVDGDLGLQNTMDIKLLLHFLLQILFRMSYMLFFEFLAFSQAICVTGIKFFPNRGSVSFTGGVLGVTSDLIASPICSWCTLILPSWIVKVEKIFSLTTYSAIQSSHIHEPRMLLSNLLFHNFLFLLV